MPVDPPLVYQAQSTGLGEVGVDIVLTERVRAMLTVHGEDIFTRMLTPAELDDCRKDGELDLLSIAGRIAAKEATFKAICHSEAPLPWLAIEVHKDPVGRPYLKLTGSARTLAVKAQVGQIRLSISHDGDYAVAMAVAACRCRPPLAPSYTEGTANYGRERAAAQGLDPQAAPPA
jgi:holo-[acyl-carrier protein] synthase